MLKIKNLNSNEIMCLEQQFKHLTKLVGHKNYNLKWNTLALSS